MLKVNNYKYTKKNVQVQLTSFYDKVVSGIFQLAIDTIHAGWDFAVGYLDDIFMKSVPKEQRISYVKKDFE